ncbi:MAG: hypothetical protein MJ211_10375 [Bacteroidales bacterium]|nr:hypothetical protein [Bacteroidales bacterium]
MKKSIYKLLIIVLFTGIYACEELESYGPMPEVEFVKVYLADTIDALKNNVIHQKIYLNVIDGDGNLGLNKEDSSGNFSIDSIYYHNLFLTVNYKDSTGNYNLLKDLSENLKYRIPYNKPVGQNKYLKAEIKVDLDIPKSYIKYDTIQYEFYVYDRELNKSNICKSCDIPINLHGTVYADGNIKKVKEKEDTKKQ